MKYVRIFGGGTVAHVANHLAVCAPAYGTTARVLAELCRYRFGNCVVTTHLTKMADPKSSLETNEDVRKKVEQFKEDLDTKVIFFNCALVDYEPSFFTSYKLEKDQFEAVLTNNPQIGKYKSRFDTKKNPYIDISLHKSEKIISNIRKERKDIFLVGFKTTCGASKQEMYEKGLRLCKESSVNLVLVNDTKTRWNMIVTPEEASYHETDNREEVLKNLVDMAYYRSQLTFTQSIVVKGNPIPWDSPLIPNNLREVINYCINGKAYKPFNGSTVGHFAVKLSDTEFLTSIRKSNFNDLAKTGMVWVETSGPDTVLAYGAKPSVGGQSQRIVFRDHVGFDCIVHFHCPLKRLPKDSIPIVSQREVECGSHQCGKQTSSGLKQFGNLKAVMLDNHGPNIVFSKNTDPKEVIKFIEDNFELTEKTGGYTI